jgi:hypothetical protein
MQDLEAFGTIVLAIATWYLAYKTKVLADEGRSAQDQAELQHRQQLMPLVVAVEGMRAVSPSQWKHGGSQKRAFQFSSVLANRGVGPALKIRVFLSIQGHEEKRFSCSGDLADLPIPPLGAKDSVDADDFRLEVHSDLSLSDQYSFSYALQYEDVFGQTFRTEYCSSGILRFVPPET